MNQKQQNLCLRTNSSLRHWGRCLNTLCWYQIFALEFVALPHGAVGLSAVCDIIPIYI